MSTKTHDPYLQAAEGFLHSIRAELDMADDLEMDRTLRVTQTYALLSIARSLNELAERGAPEEAGSLLTAAAALNN
ncbi:hypothetical protein ACPPVO_09605 [Dactylosporangium sp. McL0621]|uniref:hypothetical protein n=1 Tax=Dactylosporangium sp. McL0621 TaxID=3415678 RepID=UPI003CEFDDEA